MGELSIKIKIADREYPLKVDQEEEELLRAAGKQLNEKIRQFKTMFGIDDYQNVITMVAFDLMVELERSSNDGSTLSEEAKTKLINIKKYLDQHI